MRAKSDNLRSTPLRRSHERHHLPHDVRRAQILDKASVFFSEYGLTGQTRHLAAACGVSQRLLYSYFPNKAALLDEVYRIATARPFDEAWLDRLQETGTPLRDRLIAFYTSYADHTLTRRWLRLFLYSSLGDNPLARIFDDNIVTRILDTVFETARRDLGLETRKTPAERRRIAWALHGSVVMSGIRVHVYSVTTKRQWHREIVTAVDGFIAAMPAQCAGDGAA